MCPNQVSPATISRITRASGIRSGASPEAKAISAEEAAETLIAMVRTKSTIRAPIGMKAQASPKAEPAAAAAPPPCGKRPISSW
jgi:hypothetical protein